jgi:hypothetical protein
MPTITTVLTKKEKFIKHFPCYISKCTDCTHYLPFGDSAIFPSKIEHMQYYPASHHSLLGKNILPITLFASILNLGSSLIVRDQVAHPYKKR